ncbi:MAG: hypothetical protein IPO26_15440 [Saprospiraceae bacterium]|nr:hypothetical protein [Saprospiraceae bacterium]
MEVQFYYRKLKFRYTNTSFSSDQGELICYTNGMHVNGRDDQRILGGDTINFCPYWEYFEGKAEEGYGFALTQGAIFINNPGHENQILCIEVMFNIKSDTTEALCCGIIGYDDGFKATVIKKISQF